MILSQKYNLSGYSEYYVSSLGFCKIKRGPYNRVQNVSQLIDFRNKSRANMMWVYSPQEGPFRALGQERITQIVTATSPLDPILRLNEAMTKLFKRVYNQIELHLENQECPTPSISVCKEPVLNINKLTDSQGTNLLCHCIQLIVDEKTDVSAVDRFVKLGGDLNASIKFSFFGKSIKAPALTYLLGHLGGSDSLNTKLFQIMDRFIALGANLDHTFGEDKDNCVSALIKSLLPDPLPSPLPYILYWYEKNGGDINFKNSFGDTFLHLALYNENSKPAYNISAARALIEHGVNVSEPDGCKDHPIHLLCQHGDNNEGCKGLLKAILEKAPEELNARDNCDWTPLYWSIRTGKQLFIDVLLQRELIVSAQEAISCLYAFAEYIGEDSRKCKWVGPHQFFSENSIDDKLRETYLPLLKSVIPLLFGNAGNLRSCMIKVEKEMGESFLHYIAGKCPWILDFFLEEKFILPGDLLLKNKDGTTVERIGTKTDNSFLMLLACYHLDRGSAEELLEKDVCLNLDLCMEYENSLLHIILEKVSRNPTNMTDNSLENGFFIFKKLLKKGINPNLRNSKGENPLLQAINTGNSLLNPFILELLNYDAYADMADNKGIMTARKRIDQMTGWDIARNAVLGTPYKSGQKLL